MGKDRDLSHRYAISKLEHQLEIDSVELQPTMMELRKHLKYRTTLGEFIEYEIGYNRGAKIAHCYLCGHNHYDFGTSSLVEQVYRINHGVIYTIWRKLEEKKYAETD